MESAVKFIKEYKRMCDSFESCVECPFSSSPKICLGLTRGVSDPEEIIKIVSDWAAKNPERHEPTLKDKFLEAFPNAMLDSDTGEPKICPRHLWPQISCEVDSCNDCWLRPASLINGKPADDRVDNNKK